jgi:hypothetical protein
MIHPKNNFILCCDVCGCVQTIQQAEEKHWGILFGQPSCSKACAGVLYEPAIVEQHWKGKEDDC